jgi:hypothetical protein
MRPIKGTYPDYYENYIPLVKNNSIIEALNENEVEIRKFFASIPSSKENHAYQIGKWTIKQILGHIIDTERIFSYRALRYARKDQTLLPSYEHDDYVKNAELEKRNLQDLINEFETVRRSTLSLFNSFGSEALLRTGNTPAGQATVLAVGYTICGHAIHHMNVVRERYLGK